jgi:WD40 repeat protein
VAIEASEDGSRLYYSGFETISCFEVASGKRLWAIRFESSPGPLSASPDGRTVAAVVGHGITLLSAVDGSPVGRYAFECAEGIRYPGMLGMATSWGSRPRFSPEGRSIAVNTPVGDLLVLDATTMTPRLKAPRQPHLAWLEDVVWFRDGRLLVGSSDNHATIWELEPLVQRLTCQLVDDD